MTPTLTRVRILAVVATIALFGAASAPAFSEDGFVAIHMENQKIGSAVAANARLVASETSPAWLMCVPAKSIAEGAFWVPDLNRSAMLKMDSGNNVVVQHLAAQGVYFEGSTGTHLGGVWVTTPTFVAQ
jgi:hypothetical protein